MKLVDILFVLSAAATVNAILPPADKYGSPQASGTFSQVSDPTNEPNPGTSDDWQEVMDAINSSIFDEDWRNILDPIDPNTSDQDWQQPIDQPSSSTSSQVSGPNNELILEIPDQDWQDIMDELDSSIFDEDWRNILDPIDPSTSNEDWKQPIDQPSSSTSSQVPDPIDQVGTNTFDKDQQQPADQPSSSIPKQTQQHLMDATDLNISDKDQQQPIDQSSPSTSSQGRKRPIGDSSSSGAPKRSRKRRIDQPNPSTSDEYWKPLFDIINPNIPSQDQQQPMEQVESANTSSNQVTGLSRKFQRTFDGLKQGLIASKELRDKKWQQYRRYVDLEFEQQMTLAMGKEISGSKYDPNVQKQLKQEYEKLRRKVYSTRQKLKNYMKKHGLEFDEPDPD
ncbi:hypothetical protein BATDEDRAFT_92093 [Batrachochytrium dendrobatidis JAM81]|uniref:OCEL domain-containing protein n=1 Tax=Batrachochytrium dendrobatidis (strain JAM81 / FGSC 10211) TaxID=684364 RepID=F4PCJ8_BATDJ|nr:uncharacterized protein BATDEDRAFT_92093 [Batrachochytrium dendrobatidis JAM81]EGF77145.1 hypothetical protein BATDEDRAFT_92093 [Batrachochytrium dendrobatidis JAM81]|eukprot:XP_006682289.1 hypothetical protein BATDEDRAFT_92093 [Batrachochytrium dendrobatidis JAM81]